jgi:hypothetical protein
MCCSRILNNTAAVLSIVIAILLCSCTPFKTSEPDGPQKVGVTVKYLVLVDRELKLTIWYPAKPGPGAVPHMFDNNIIGSAFFDADFDPSGGPYPLIIFSPGLGASGDSYVFYTENLASFGYVVVGINHLDANQNTEKSGSGFRGYSELNRALYELGRKNSSDTVFILNRDWFIKTEFGLTYRPQEISFTIDQAVQWNQDPSSMFFNMIDTNNIGMTGHSLGGYMTLLKGGMPFLCDYELSPGDCDVARMSAADWDPCCTESVQALQNPFALKDDLIKAILPLAPPIFHKNSEIGRNAARIETPLMIITGDDPHWEASFAPIWEVSDNASGPKYLVEIRDCDHFVVTDMIETLPEGVKKMIPGPKSNHTHFAGKARAYKDYSATFFNLYLKGDKKEIEILHEPNQRFVKRLWYQE